jgi:hypothetical protein
MSSLRSERPVRIEARHRLVMLTDMPFRNEEGKLKPFSPSPPHYKELRKSPGHSRYPALGMTFVKQRERPGRKLMLSTQICEFRPLERPKSKMERRLDRLIKQCEGLGRSPSPARGDRRSHSRTISMQRGSLL